MCTMTTTKGIIHTNCAVLCLLFYRIVVMYLVPLEPPVDCIPLRDELLRHTTYGDKVLTKDLFFSGHTASAVLLFHLVQDKWKSRFFLLMSVVIGAMVIIQHVHYTIDVIAAYFFAHLAYRSGCWIADKGTMVSRFVFLQPLLARKSA